MPFAGKNTWILTSLALGLCLLTGCGLLRPGSQGKTPTAPEAIETTAVTAEAEPTPELDPGTPEMDFAGMSFEELCEKLPKLTALRKAKIPEDSLTVEQFRTLSQLRPDVEFDYDFTVNGKPGSIGFTRLDLRTADSAGMRSWLAWAACMPELQSIELGTGDTEKAWVPWDALAELRAARPEIAVNGSFTLYGKEFTLESTEMNLTHIPIADQGALVKAITACMPKLTYLDMDSCGVDDEHMAEIRDGLPNANVVWRIWFGERGHGFAGYSVRTDVTKILASNPGIGGELDPENTKSLKYCTKVKYLDVGHNSYMRDISFVAYMPDLEMVVLAMGDWFDASPLENCTKLRYAELQTTSLSDLRPLTKLQNLEDLNLCYCYALHDITPLYEMPNLKRLYLGMLTPVPTEQVEEFKKLNPGCEVDTEIKDPTTGHWRYLGWDEYGDILAPSYARLREVMEYDSAPACYAYPYNDPLY
ncbi:MAG: leucine-rich repeat domain-containing protein [Eubacteriales bacterium]|nr:leucine-rich repeat domain-containing protein [Eubacteriales bacterium]